MLGMKTCPHSSALTHYPAKDYTYTKRIYVLFVYTRNLAVGVHP